MVQTWESINVNLSAMCSGVISLGHSFGQAWFLVPSGRHTEVLMQTGKAVTLSEAVTGSFYLYSVWFLQPFYTCKTSGTWPKAHGRKQGEPALPLSLVSPRLHTLSLPFPRAGLLVGWMERKISLWQTSPNGPSWTKLKEKATCSIYDFVQSV